MEFDSRDDNRGRAGLRRDRRRRVGWLHSWLQCDGLAVAQLPRAFDDHVFTGADTGEQVDFACGRFARADKAEPRLLLFDDEDGFQLGSHHQCGWRHLNRVRRSDWNQDATELAARSFERTVPTTSSWAARETD